MLKDRTTTTDLIYKMMASKMFRTENYKTKQMLKGQEKERNKNGNKCRK